jgi:predicted nucleotide-binding protein (sugar kinase/HSP70/actin superfamily)
MQENEKRKEKGSCPLFRADASGNCYPSRMRITYPHIGDLTLALEGFFDDLGIEAVFPPAPGDRVLAAGARHSPETVCLPYKHVLGELILSLEKGADTLVLIGGRGPCRFGFYDVAQDDALRELGFRYRVVSTENPDSIWNLVREFKAISPRNSLPRIAWETYLFCRRIEAIDEVHDEANRIRWRAGDPAAFAKAVAAAKRRVADSRTLLGLRRARREALESLAALPLAPETETPLRVGIAGEFYTVVDPDTNFHVERVLGELGAEVVRGVRISQWLNDRWRFRPLTPSDRNRARRAARPYLSFSPGGEAIVTVSRAIDWHREGFDGMVHLLPFTCMPELVAASVLPCVLRDHPLPLLRLVIDEHTDGTGVRTRLEAFVDTLLQRKTAAAAAPKG